MTAGSRRAGIVGGGLVGLAVGRRLALDGFEVTIFEKEKVLSAHQSGHNSGVVHSGIYYTPGSLKATLCRRGVDLLKQFCVEHELVYREIGKVIVARNEAEIAPLRDLQERARLNGVPDVRWLGQAELREIEPNVAGIAALHSPTTAIVDYPAVAHAMAADIVAAGGQIKLGTEIRDIQVNGATASIVADSGNSYEFDHVVLCAGLQSDTVARIAGDVAGPAIIPFRGEYLRLVPARKDLVNGLVYPVPDPAYPFLGVHFTPRVDGAVDIGPNALLATAREGYRRRDVNLREFFELLRWPGSRKLFHQHWKTGIHEMKGSFSTRAYVKSAQDYVPALTVADVVRAPAGVRAQAVDADGTLVDDFRISRLGAVTAVRNAPSPAATSSLAIGEYVVSQMFTPGSGANTN
ncbi:hydroxyglutarate oxidase [Rhodococcus sp. ACPA4]|uniref:L-2-hydroxyglutarate oxidase n=1 Tax=Rhodococcus TaxID=1827 RepID=UPI0005D388B4|nr:MULTISPECIES: L-2-hydroxyglutarate oxidase [unclassified Rhodococcus (in: high G+C Gram-positive bacteria)]KJF24629.1 L-2-hydroxyglutarate oxidase LhgO [Rhodococcus sp. AD45]PBC43498.1 hydroxyglutarate oxidase [Rhodococcus sp. ACPA4]PSR42896.1 L-2-hydroxyglutarate oxidase [Rhodococcus sp. AD45-ID]